MTTRPYTDGAAEPLVLDAEPTPAQVKAEAHQSARHIPGEAGIWIFILGDMTLYTALFASFMFERARDVELFNQCAGTLHTNFGAINTLLLLTSSLFVALGVRALREQIKPELARVLFVGSLICGFGFVVIKYFEYSDLLRAGHYPAANLFYMYYYVLTGIHLTHLLAGMLVLLYMWRVSSKGFCEPEEIGGIENGASFWHAVDLLWIVLFPLLYLVR